MIGIIYMDNCYDCTIEKLLHTRYLNSKFNVFSKDFTPINLLKLVNLTLSGNKTSSILKHKWKSIINNLLGSN